MPDPTVKRILIGRIASAHGIRGDILVKSYAADPEGIASYGPLADETGKRSFRLKIVRLTPKGVICRVDGVTDRNGAEALARTDLYVPRDRLPPPAEGEYYHVDLIGLAAEAPDGSAIGEVVAVQNFGASDLLEIRMPGRKATELVPLTDAFVPSVDVAAGRAVVIMPELTEADADEPSEPPASQDQPQN